MFDQIINPSVNLELIKEEFKKNKVVVIQDFFKEDIAESLYSWFSEDMPSEWWDVSTFPQKGDKGPTFVRNTEENYKQIRTNYEYSLQAFAEGKFAYNFYRTKDNHFDDCTCKECNLRKWLVKPESLDFISEATGTKYTDSDEVFAACYGIGDYLSPHVDSPNGTLGFVYQLSKNWLPEYGGLLHFMDDEREHVERVEVPAFNTLTLFYLPENKGKWHFVSPVSPGTPELRFTYTGWFK
jgi:Rps23 Pro-64 3,4-dihydroxylase Tpa1-like proline 4-hydroxylase